MADRHKIKSLESDSLDFPKQLSTFSREFSDIVNTVCASEVDRICKDLSRLANASNSQELTQLAADLATVNRKIGPSILDLLNSRFSNHFAEISLAQSPGPIQGEVPVDDIVTSLTEGKKVIPFLGAGVPLSSRPPNAIWTPQSDFLPSSVELASFLAALSGMPVWFLKDTDNLARVASYYCAINRQVTIGQRLVNIFTKGTPTPTHDFLASLPARLGHPLLIVTTNYDLLMEKAFQNANCEYDRVVHCGKTESKASIYLQKFGEPKMNKISDEELGAQIDWSTRSILYKMHGSIDALAASGPAITPIDRDQHSDCVITEEDYVDFLARIHASPPAVPQKIKQYFDFGSFLFLGYSLDDWNLRVILHSLKGVLKRNSNPARYTVDENDAAASLGIAAQRAHWSIQKNPTEYDAAVWRGRNVTIGSRDLNEFVTILSDQLATAPPPGNP